MRTVAGRLGHADGGTTLAYYAAWVREADQRASRILMRHLPMPRPPEATAPGASPTFRRPTHPYQVIAAELRAAILAGALPAGTVLPTVTQLGARHHVAPAPSTAPWPCSPPNTSSRSAAGTAPSSTHSRPR